MIRAASTSVELLHAEHRLVELLDALRSALHRIDSERVAILPAACLDDPRSLFATPHDEEVLAAERAEGRVLAALRALVESIEAELNKLGGGVEWTPMMEERRA